MASELKKQDTETDVVARFDELFTFLQTLIDEKHVILVYNSKLQYWAHHAILAWQESIVDGCDHELERALQEKVSRLQASYIKTLGLSHHINTANCQGVNSEVIRTRTMFLVDFATNPIKQGVQRAQQIIRCLQNTSLMPYFRRVDEYIDSVLYAIRRVVTNNIIRDPLFSRTPLNAIVARSSSSSVSYLAKNDISSFGPTHELRWSSQIPWSAESPNVTIPQSKVPSSLDYIAKQNTILLAGLVLLEPLFTDTASDVVTGENRRVLPLASEIFGYRKLAINWKQWMVEQHKKSAASVLSQNAEKYRKFRSYMTLAVMARFRYDYMKRIDDSAHRKADAVEAVSRYINCVQYYFRELDDRKHLPKLFTEHFEHDLKVISDYFPPFQCQLNRSSQENTRNENDTSQRQTDKQKCSAFQAAVSQEINATTTHTNHDITNDILELNKCFSLQLVLGSALNILQIIRLNAEVREAFNAKIDELKEYIPVRCPGVILFKLIYPLVPVIVIGMLPALINTVISNRIVSNISDNTQQVRTVQQQREQELAFTALVLFSFYCCKVTVKYNKDQLQQNYYIQQLHLQQQQQQQSHHIHSQVLREKQKNYSNIVSISKLLNIVNNVNSSDIVQHIQIIRMTRFPNWERSFWLNSGGSESDNNTLDIALRRAHFVYLNT